MTAAKVLCANCKAEVWWSLSRPEDTCPECHRPIGLNQHGAKA